jgi:hypothetical protein
MEKEIYGSATSYSTHVSSTVLTTVLIHYCCDNNRKVRAPTDDRRSWAPQMYWPHEKRQFYMETPFAQLNLSSVEHVWVDYHVAESTLHSRLSKINFFCKNFKHIFQITSMTLRCLQIRFWGVGENFWCVSPLQNFLIYNKIKDS